jgi:hypothetical protein
MYKKIIKRYLFPTGDFIRDLYCFCYISSSAVAAFVGVVIL